MKKKRSRVTGAKPGKFDASLQQRAAAFLARPIPEELHPDYLSDSLADRLIAACARNEAIDPEALELAELASGEYEELIAAAQSEELKTYYATSRDLLVEIVEAGRR